MWDPELLKNVVDRHKGSTVNYHESCGFRGSALALNALVAVWELSAGGPAVSSFLWSNATKRNNAKLGCSKDMKTPLVSSKRRLKYLQQKKDACGNSPLKSFVLRSLWTWLTHGSWKWPVQWPSPSSGPPRTPSFFFYVFIPKVSKIFFGFFGRFLKMLCQKSVVLWKGSTSYHKKWKL